MSYHIYTTKGIVLSERPRREADRLYTVLTRDLGLIRASAGGVRKEMSKLRGSLEPFSISNISFVRGKGDWRITSASLVSSLIGRQDRLKIFARAFSLIEKLVAGEEKHPEIFEIIEEASKFGTDEEIEVLEIWLVSKVLFELGYLTKENIPETLEAIKIDKKQFIKSINTGLQESGLV